MVSNSSGKVKRLTFRLPNDIYEKFFHKSYTEGYSLQKALELLVENYVTEQINVEKIIRHIPVK